MFNCEGEEDRGVLGPLFAALPAADEAGLA